MVSGSQSARHAHQHSASLVHTLTPASPANKVIAASTLAFLITYNRAPVLWKSKKTKLIAKSTAESEYIAIDATMQHITAIERLCVDSQLMANGLFILGPKICRQKPWWPRSTERKCASLYTCAMNSPRTVYRPMTSAPSTYRPTGKKQIFYENPQTH